MAKYAYFPGCSAESTGISQTISLMYVAPKLNIELTEIPDWNCCGTSAARLTDVNVSLALPARSLAISEKEMPDRDVFSACAGCSQSLKYSSEFAKGSQENLEKIQRLVGMPYEAKADVVNILDILSNAEAMEALKEHMVKEFNGLKVACYYGCALIRPEKIWMPDDSENPQVMDNIVRALGGDAIDWAYKVECCGASNHITIPAAGKKMSKNILENAIENGAEIIVTGCPLCWMNLDMREYEINKIYGTDIDIPVYYITELIAAALGGDAHEIGIDKHFRRAEGLLEKLVEVKKEQVDQKPLTNETTQKKTGVI